MHRLQAFSSLSPGIDNAHPWQKMEERVYGLGEGEGRGNCLRMRERREGGRKRGGSIGQEDQMEM